jgi:hypothetical protein
MSTFRATQGDARDQTLEPSGRSPLLRPRSQSNLFVETTNSCDDGESCRFVSMSAAGISVPHRRRYQRHD